MHVGNNKLCVSIYFIDKKLEGFLGDIFGKNREIITCKLYIKKNIPSSVLQHFQLPYHLLILVIKYLDLIVSFVIYAQKNINFIFIYEVHILLLTTVYSFPPTLCFELIEAEKLQSESAGKYQK